MKRRDFLKTTATGAAALAAGCRGVWGQKGKSMPYNVLFLPVDDLRPQLGCYGQKQTLSPNIDALAAEGVTFRRAYCQVPVCGASRASVLSGLRPRPDRFVNYKTWLKKDAKGVRTMPQHFREAGYAALSIGKVFHHRNDCGERSWSEEPWWAKPNGGTWRDYYLGENQKAEAEGDRRGRPYECADVDDDAYRDGKIANHAIEDLRRLAKAGKPFFLAAGFLKPHLPFNAPKRYWDRYKRDDIHLADNPYRPKNAPDEAMHEYGELRQYAEVPRDRSKDVGDELARTLIHGYYACTSYTDAQVGRVIDELKALDLYDKTIIMLWGDHGWQLGEHGLWCKHCNFRTSLNAPLVVRTPEMKRGAVCDQIVEFVDMYPTLCDLAGLPKPDHLQGDSFAPLIQDPTARGKEAAFCRYHDGDSVKTDRYLYTEWRPKGRGQRVARMLYDHRADLEENINVAEDPAKADVVKELSAMLPTYE